MSFCNVEAWIIGSTALLQNRATEEALSGKTRSTNPVDELDPREQAAKCVYRLPSGQIALPGAAFARMLREAGGSHKVKGSRKSLKYILPAAVVILDDLCGLYLNDRKTPITDFEVDTRPVTIPATKGRIIRHRARFNEWSCKIRLRINEFILDEALVRRIFGEGTLQIGVGDFRPEKGGPFGTSDVVAWDRDVIKPLTEAQSRNTRRVA